MDDPYDLERFIEEQKTVFPRVVAELELGRKRSHWMWFVFPQIEGLGRSPIAKRYAIGSVAEAKAYLDHDVLGARLRKVTEIVVGIEHRSVHEIFDQPDDIKFRSSLTLFGTVSPGEVFDAALTKYFNGKPDPATLERLR